MNSILSESLYQEDLYEIPGKVLVILSKGWNEVTAEEKTQLTKIVNALKMNLESIQILHLDSISVNALVSLSPKKIISFGVAFNPPLLPYQATSAGEISVIQADALDSLDDAKKKTLWLELRKMFGI